MDAANVALTWPAGLMTPRQLGPITLIPERCAVIAHFFLKLFAGWSRFSKARRNDQCSRDLFGCAFFDNSRHGSRWRDNHRQFGRFR